ncbi:MAG: shikimate kinase [Euryarchaeota archaeon]|nr:shikimate kinase [Euryarchaeota archaeon]
MRGAATVHGAATIVNALATGKGAAFGIGLTTTAEVELTADPTIAVAIEGQPDETTRLAEECVRRTLDHVGMKEQGARATTKSDIPISRGLKSSSAAANALVLATSRAAGRSLGPEETISLGVDAALAAGVSVTGAYDDACASYFGGVVVTDNVSRLLISRREIDPSLRIAILVPARQIRKTEAAKVDYSPVRAQMEACHGLAAEGRWMKALTLNGIYCSAVAGLSLEATAEAIRAGSLAAGLTGTGPATVAVCSEATVDAVKAAWGRLEGEIILSRPTNGGLL